MRRLNDDDDAGVVAVLVAVLAVILIGLAAVVIDVGALYSERRQLQNGADAAALAVAQSCAQGACGNFASDAEVFADGNAVDGAARIAAGEVCGTTTAGLPACIDPPTGLVGNGYVRVTVRTEEKDGSKLVPPFLAKVLLPDYDGTEVTASSIVVWGPASAATSDIPVTLSECEFKEFSTANGVAPAPDYVKYPPLGYAGFTSANGIDGSRYERTFYTHDAGTAAQVSSCPSTAPGGDAAGSFGWLDDPIDAAGCSVTTTVSPTGDLGYQNAQGNTVPSECKSSFPPAGTLVFLPIYDYFTVKDVTVDPSDKTPGGGNNVWYHLAGYSGFYITGYNLQLPGKADAVSLVTGKAPCGGENRCISGFFTSALMPPTGTVGTGTSYESNITQLVR